MQTLHRLFIEVGFNLPSLSSELVSAMPCENGERLPETYICIIGFTSLEDVKKFDARLSKPENRSMYHPLKLCYLLDRINRSATSDVFVLETSRTTFCGTLMMSQSGHGSAFVSTVGGLIAIGHETYVITTSHSPEEGYTPIGNLPESHHDQRLPFDHQDVFDYGDWRLALVRPDCRRPNAVIESYSDSMKGSAAPIIVKYHLPMNSRIFSYSRNVLIASGRSGLKEGILSKRRTFLMSKAHNLQAVWLIDLGHDDFRPGDSGSWIIHKGSHLLLGVLIARSTNSGYMVPFTQIQKDISETLKIPATAVRPTGISKRQSRAAAQPREPSFHGTSLLSQELEPEIQSSKGQFREYLSPSKSGHADAKRPGRKNFNPTLIPWKTSLQDGLRYSNSPWIVELFVLLNISAMILIRTPSSLSMKECLISASGLALGYAFLLSFFRTRNSPLFWRHQRSGKRPVMIRNKAIWEIFYQSGLLSLLAITAWWFFKPRSFTKGSLTESDDVECVEILAYDWLISAVWVLNLIDVIKTRRLWSALVWTLVTALAFAMDPPHSSQLEVDHNCIATSVIQVSIAMISSATAISWVLLQDHHLLGQFSSIYRLYADSSVSSRRPAFELPQTALNTESNVAKLSVTPTQRTIRLKLFNWIFIPGLFLVFVLSAYGCSFDLQGLATSLLTNHPCEFPCHMQVVAQLSKTQP
ncbi:hypothetical protein CKAH01_09595 [Colletotrichum kahawae]|uniref:Uncharacterized protein n=1 Tax=Colletotrichum kahawae TaxID=34407 RepID=A0AAD9Y1A0_COLKA|nr:hypothetical protein CKAH01_09595 [Colletotrichum kahawae]